MSDPSGHRGAPPVDVERLLKMTVAEALKVLLDRSSVADDDPWIDPKSPECPVPYRQILAAAQRGELMMFKVGRKLLVKKTDLDAWIERPEHRVGYESASAPSGSAADLVLERNGWRKKPTGSAS